MKVEKSFNFTLFRDVNTSNTISVGRNKELSLFVLKPTKNSFNSEVLYIDENIYNSFFIAENLAIASAFTSNLVVNI